MQEYCAQLNEVLSKSSNALAIVSNSVQLADMSVVEKLTGLIIQIVSDISSSIRSANVLSLDWQKQKQYTKDSIEAMRRFQILEQRRKDEQEKVKVVAVGTSTDDFPCDHCKKLKIDNEQLTKQFEIMISENEEKLAKLKDELDIAFSCQKPLAAEAAELHKQHSLLQMEHRVECEDYESSIRKLKNIIQSERNLIESQQIKMDLLEDWRLSRGSGGGKSHRNRKANNNTCSGDSSGGTGDESAEKIQGEVYTDVVDGSGDSDSGVLGGDGGGSEPVDLTPTNSNTSAETEMEMSSRPPLSPRSNRIAPSTFHDSPSLAYKDKYERYGGYDEEEDVEGYDFHVVDEQNRHLDSGDGGNSSDEDEWEDIPNDNDGSGEMSPDIHGYPPSAHDRENDEAAHRGPWNAGADEYHAQRYNANEGALQSIVEGGAQSAVCTMSSYTTSQDTLWWNKDVMDQEEHGLDSAYTEEEDHVCATHYNGNDDIKASGATDGLSSSEQYGDEHKERGDDQDSSNESFNITQDTILSHMTLKSSSPTSSVSVDDSFSLLVNYYDRNVIL